MNSAAGVPEAPSAPGSPTRDAVSVVVCSIGRSDVARCVASVCASADAAGADVEVIVVWQDATSPPPAFASAVRVVDAFPAGVAYARNRGLSAVSRDIVAYIDDDEVADPTWIATLVDALREDGAVAAFGAVEQLDADGLPYCRYSGAQSRTFTSPSTPPWIVGTEGNMAFRATVLQEVGAFDLTFGIGAPNRSAEGADLIVRFLSAGHRVDFRPDAVVYHPSKTAAERLASRFPYGWGMGKVVRRHRDPVLGAKYAAACVQNLAKQLRRRDMRGTREAVRTVAGFGAAVSRRTQPRAAMSHLDLLPPAVAEAVSDSPVVPLRNGYRARPHFVYQVGTDRVLHAYAAPTDDLHFAQRERSVIRDATRLEGIPALVRSAPGRDVLWVLEERVPGEPIGANVDPSRWFPAAAAWITKLAGEPGPPLDETPRWMAMSRSIAVSVPEPAADAVARAMREVGQLGAVHLHGDYQRKNIHFDGGRVGAVDWETAEAAGLPGQDLLFLAATAVTGAPDAALLRDLTRGIDPPFGSVLAPLASIGVTADRLSSLLLVVAARWRLQERQRLSFPGARPAPPVHEALFEEILSAVS